MLLTLLDIYNNKPGLLAKQYDSTVIAEQKRKCSHSSYRRDRQEKERIKVNNGFFQSLVNV